MPDLTLDIMQQCKAGRLGQTFHIRGYEQFIAYNETTADRCTCPAFTFSRFPKGCKHLEQAKQALCDYHEQTDGKPALAGVCPKCGGPTVYVKVAV